MSSGQKFEFFFPFSQFKGRKRRSPGSGGFDPRHSSIPGPKDAAFAFRMEIDLVDFRLSCGVS
jgi:hypothetical protein